MKIKGATHSLKLPAFDSQNNSPSQPDLSMTFSVPSTVLITDSLQQCLFFMKTAVREESISFDLSVT